MDTCGPGTGPTAKLRLCSVRMSFLRVAPQIDISADQIHGSTALAARLLVLFAYCRYVTIDRRRQVVKVTTRWFWIWTVERVIPFARIGRIIYRAQGVPSLSLSRYLLGPSTDFCDSAFFLISIAIKATADDRHAREELALFSIWEQQPRELRWIDRLAGTRINPARVGDETSGAIVDTLKEYLGVPVASH